MITLIALLPAAAFVVTLALVLQVRRIRKLSDESSVIASAHLSCARTEWDRANKEWAASDLRADWLADQLHETGERLASAEQDIGVLQMIAAGHLRRAWRAERALVAVRNRDEAAAYAEAATRKKPAEAGNERLLVRPPALGEPVLAGIDMALYELEMDQ